MEKPKYEELVEVIVTHDPRYHREAYEFLREALEFAQRRFARDKDEGERHVSGRQLLEAIRLFALQEYGPMSRTVFEEWGVTRCEDFGEIVFNLIDHNVLRKQDSDTRADFSGGYGFDEAFVEPFLPPSQLRAAQTPAEAS